MASSPRPFRRRIGIERYLRTTSALGIAIAWIDQPRASVRLTGWVTAIGRPSLTESDAAWPPARPDRSAHRWTGAGEGRLGDGTGPPTTDFERARLAARTATADALGGPDPRLLLVVTPTGVDLDGVRTGVRQIAGGGIAVIGCATSAEIGPSRSAGGRVVVWALGGDEVSAATGIGRAGRGGLRSATADAATCVERVDERHHRVLLVLSDALAGDQHDVVRGAYRTAGAGWPMVGAATGDGRTGLLHGNEVVRNAVVAAAITSDAPIGVGLRHGWTPLAPPMVVTASDGNRIVALDGEPALDVYLELLHAPVSARSEGGSFTHMALRHPLCSTHRGHEEIRGVVGADFGSRTLSCMAPAPEGSFVCVMRGDADSVRSSTERAGIHAIAGLGGRQPIGLLTFDCVARRTVSGEDEARLAQRRLRELARGPVAGVYSHAQFARLHGPTGLHTETVVDVAFC